MDTADTRPHEACVNAANINESLYPLVARYKQECHLPIQASGITKKEDEAVQLHAQAHAPHSAYNSNCYIQQNSCMQRSPYMK